MMDPEDSYLGRVRRIFDMLDVRTAFTSKQNLQEAIKVVQKGADGKWNA